MKTAISVITATWQRPQLLALCLAQYQQQSLGTLVCEHIVVSDGGDERAKAMAEHFGARYLELEQHQGGWGAYGNDAGVQLAQGKYVVFWNDDNMYYPHALASLYAAANGADIGICQAVHWQGSRNEIIPKAWHGQFVSGDVDAMCVCVRRELAILESWGGEPVPYDVDFHWLIRLQRRDAVIRFVPVVIGEHL